MHHREPQYFLSRHAFICVAQGYAVFLDVKPDKHSALIRAEALTVRQAVAVCPVTELDQSGDTPEPASEGVKLLQKLREERFISEVGLAGKMAKPVALEETTSDLRSFVLGSPRLSLRHVVDFVADWARITVALHTRPLEYSIERVRVEHTCEFAPTLTI